MSVSSFKVVTFLNLVPLFCHVNAQKPIPSASAEPINILVYGAIGSHSTRISMLPYMEALVSKGYHVTFLSSYVNFDQNPQSRSPITYFNPPKWTHFMANNDWEDRMNFFDIRRSNQFFQMWWDLHDVGIESCTMLYSDPEFISWVKRSNFSLVVAESAANECAYGLAHIFNAKLAIYGTSTLFPWFTDAYGFPDESSTVPDVAWAFPLRHEGLNFVERIKNLLTSIVLDIKREHFYFPQLEKITREGMALKQIPSFRDIERNTSLILMSTHATIDYPRSLPPHGVNIAGSVITGNAKPLPPEIKKFLDSAKYPGFIYISFGSIAEFTNFDKNVQLEFIEALKAFPEVKFLWKLGGKLETKLPENVLVTKWVPQQTVLGHKNIKAFVTHCGMGSMTEAVHFGVPLIILPVMDEQDANARVMVRRGVGIEMEVTTLTSKQLEDAISEILNNQKYSKAMSSLSKAFRDRPMSPVETGVWWTEYILRHDNSNDFLVPLSLRQPWWKRRQLDVWLVLTLTLVFATNLIILAIYLIIKKCLLSTRKSSGNIKIKVKAN